MYYPGLKAARIDPRADPDRLRRARSFHFRAAFNRITQVTVIKLIVADAVQAYGRIRSDHEIERGASWPTIKKRCPKSTGSNSSFTDKCHAHKAARAVP